MSIDPEPSARFAAAIVDSHDAAIIGQDLEGRIVTWNRGARCLYGYDGSEMRGQSFARLIPEARAEELARILAAVASGQRIEQLKTEHQHKDGHLVAVALTLTPVYEGERRVGAAAVAHELSAQQRAESSLRDSEQRWRAVIASAVDGIIVIDGRGRIEAFNASAERLFGYREADVVGRNVSLLMPSPYKEEHDGYLARYQATNEPHIIGVGREVTGRHRDGHVFPIHLSVGEMQVDGVRKFTGIIHDLTSRVRMEEQLRERAAMARLGEMAAVVAHEVKNPLAGIRGVLQVLSTRLPDRGDVEIAAQVVARLDGLNDLVDDLLVFARPPQPRLVRLDLAAVVASTEGLLARDPAMANVAVDAGGAASMILADPDLLGIVVGNLIVNSAQAMNGQGRIQITFADVGGEVELVVRDSGPGVPAAIRGNVFAPFFTTKARGTGLGLPTAKRLIEAQGGTIALACPDEGGTVVTIRFPRAPVAN